MPIPRRGELCWKKFWKLQVNAATETPDMLINDILDNQVFHGHLIGTKQALSWKTLKIRSSYRKNIGVCARQCLDLAPIWKYGGIRGNSLKFIIEKKPL